VGDREQRKNASEKYLERVREGSYGKPIERDLKVARG
jgi:hypothetical protein